MRRELPRVKSSHRVEALARGLGWSTNAAMRAELAEAPLPRTVQPDAFVAYLEKHDFAVKGYHFAQAVRRVQIRTVMNAHPELTRHGFGVREERRLSSDEWRRRYEAGRSEMLEVSAIGEFERALEFLAMLETTKGPTQVFSSYNLKHTAERWYEHRGIEGRWERVYVSNGMLLVAAWYLGLQVRRASPSAFTGFLNVSTASVRAKDDERRPQLPQPEQGKPFRILGSSHGVYSYLPAGATKPVSLRPSAHTPQNLQRLAPLAYWVSLYPPRNRRAPFNTEAAYIELFQVAGRMPIFDPPGRYYARR